MSRPPWARNESPVNRSPASNVSSSASPSIATGAAHPSFKTNVNRQKTKRWVEAKSYSYDGDDWGDVDDYDEYGAQAPVPPPAPKPTGLRQKGQGLASSAHAGTIRQVDPAGFGESTNAQPRPSPLADVDQANGSQFPAAQFAHGPLSQHLPLGHISRSPSEVVSQGPERPYEQPLQGSPLRLDTGVKGYDFGNMATSHQSASHRRLSAQSSILPAGEAPGTNVNHDSRQVEASMSPVYLQDRADDTAPTALAPSYMSSSPATEEVGATSTGGIYPPRKSSLSYSIPFNPESPAIGSQPDMRGTTQYTESPNTTVASRQRATSQPAKPLPFVRPADIYKRIEEEREKERRSLDSDRRSMDSARSRGPDSESPRRAMGIDERRGSDGMEYSPDAETSRRTTSKLEPVRERRSECGLETGTGHNEQSRPDTEGIDDPSQRRGLGQTHMPSPSVGGKTATDAPVVNHPSPYITPPILPDLARLSGFGDTFWSSGPTDRAGPESSNTRPGPRVAANQISPAQSSVSGRPEETPDGFRSVVDRAFELSEARSASQTPSVVGEKQNQGTGAEPKRSESASTAGISPIMSRVPAPATFEERLTEDGGRPAPEKDIVKGHPDQNTTTPDDKQMERSSVRSSLDPTEPSLSLQAPRSESTGSPSRSSRYDHRRNLSSSSTNNSPARSATVEVSSNLPEAEAVELSTAPPDDDREPNPENPDYSPAPSGLPAVIKTNKSEQSPAAFRHEGSVEETGPQRRNIQTAPPTVSSDSPTWSEQSPIWSLDAQTSRAGSPTKGRVRDLAGKFENQITSSVSPSSTPKRGSYSEYSMTQEDRVLQRPPPPASEASFRPALPGAWVSFSTPGNEPKPSEVLPRGSQELEDQSKPANTNMPVLNSEDRHDATDAEQPPWDAEYRSPPKESVDSAPPDKVAEVADSTRRGSPSVPEHATEMQSEDLAPSLENENDPPMPDANITRSEGLPPAPPPKDAPAGEMNPESHSTYVTRPLTPRKPEISELVTTPAHKLEVEDTTPAPSMSTDASPDDQESDKLRKEIVKSLNSPALPASPLDNYSEARQPDLLRASIESSRLNQGRDSNIFPSEYDSYWASTRDRDESERTHVLLGSPREGQSENHEVQPASPLHALRGTTDQDHPSIPERESPKIARQGHHADTISMPVHEIVSSEDSEPTRGSVAVDLADSPPPARPHAFGTFTPSAVTAELKLQQLDDRGGSSFNHGHYLSENLPKSRDAVHSLKDRKPMTEAEGGAGYNSLAAGQMPIMYPPESPHRPGSMCEPLPLERRRPSSIEKNEHVGSSRDVKTLDAPSGSGTPDKQVIQAESPGGLDSGSLDRLIRFTESEPAHFHLPDVPKHGSEADSGAPRAGDETYAAHSEASAAKPPEPVSKDTAAPAGQGRIPTFYEISAMKTPSERIKAYHSAQAYYANMDTGLAGWITSMISQNAPQGTTARERPRPVLDTTIGPHTSSPSSSSSQPRASNPSPAKISASGQPYYQQYLTFSDLSPSARAASGSTSKPLPVPGTTTPQSSGTPSGSRVSSGQVQAKGKELLHSAGVLGGKANVAAKGLFAKGKSKWRASGAEKGDH